MFTLAPKVRRRRPSLTPMIDVVFLLLVFFMLASRFGADTTLAITPAQAGSGAYNGAPRLIDVGPSGVIFLNGAPITWDALAPQVVELMTGPDDVVILRPKDGATVQDLTNVMTHLRDNHVTHLAVIGGHHAP